VHNSQRIEDLQQAAVGLEDDATKAAAAGQTVRANDLRNSAAYYRRRASSADRTAGLRQLHEAQMTLLKAIVTEPGTPRAGYVEPARAPATTLPEPVRTEPYG